MKHFILLLLSGIVCSISYSQINSAGNISGNIESNMQVLNSDTLIGAFSPDEKAVINTVMNMHYSVGKLRAGMRLESYLPSIAGYPAFYSGTGIGYRYGQYNGDDLTITVGNFYEQFGNGLILRAYEEPALGLDNAFDGINVKFTPRRGVDLKGVFGRQRHRFVEGTVERSDGIVRGIDGNFSLNELIPGFNESEFKVSIGGSFVSRFQSVTDTTPPIVNAYGGRIDLHYKRFHLNTEYVYKEADPGLQNGFVYNPGFIGAVNLGYSQKGLGVILTARSMANPVFRSDKKVIGNQLMINYLPATTNGHT